MILLLLSLLVGDANAEPYLVVGGGISTFNQVDTNGHWVQLGFDHQIDQQSNAWRIGVGWETNSWVDFELDYRNLGEFNSMIRFVSDKNYNIHTHTCNKPCEKIKAAWLHGETQGIGTSVVLSPKSWEVAPTLRLGAILHWSKFMANYARNDGITRYSYDDGGSFNDSGLSPIVGVGLRYRDIEVEATLYPYVTAGGSAYHDIHTVTINMKMRF